MSDVREGKLPKENELHQIRTILVPTDFSRISNEAFDFASMLAEGFNARVVAAHVQEDTVSGLITDYPSVEELRKVVEIERIQARKKLAEVAEEHFPETRELELCVALGVPHLEIARLAEQKEADVIVMATHGRGFVSHLLVGSTTEQVIRRSICPVFVVRGRHA